MVYLGVCNMSGYYKQIDSGYIIGIGTNGNNTVDAITVDEYNAILNIIHNKPEDPDDYQYKLRADTLEWELAELPPEPETDPTTEEEALTRYANELTGGNAETLQEATEILIKTVKGDK